VRGDRYGGETAACCVTWLNGGQAGFRANEVMMVVTMMMMMMMMMRSCTIPACTIDTPSDLGPHT
jgi:hypothetical protein